MMKSSYGLLSGYGRKKINLNEQIFKRLDKQILNQPMHENVIPRFLNKILKGQSLLPFFYVCTINLQ